MTVKVRTFKEFAYPEAAHYLAEAALEHKSAVPLIAGLYGEYSQDKVRFPNAVDTSVAERRGTRLVNVLGQIGTTSSGVRAEYEQFHQGVANTFPLIILSDIDTSCSHVDILSLEAFKKFPEFVILIESESHHDMKINVLLRSLGMRAVYAQYYEIPFAYPEFILITDGKKK